MFAGNLIGPDGGVLILVILAVLIFGSQAPKIARNLGLAGREFKKAQEESEADAAKDKAAKAAAEAAAATPAPTGASIPPAPPALGSSQPPGQERITLSRAELDALLAAREAQAKQETGDKS